MAAFEYQALDTRGRQVKGIIEADTARQARAQLREKQMMPLEVSPAAQKEQRSKASSGGFTLFKPKIGATALALITRQLSTLVAGGLPLEECIKAVAEQSEQPRLKSMLMAVRAKVVEGYGLAESMAEYPQVFDELYVAMVASGEKSGHLEVVLERLADYTERRQELNAKLTQALVYPIILTVVAISVVVFLLTSVVPDVVSQFDHLGQALPATTQFLIDISDFLQHYGLYMLIAIVLFFVGFKQALRSPKFKLSWHETLLKLPVVGKVSRGLNTARFARTLSTLSSSGVPMLEAMKIASDVLLNLKVKNAVSEATGKVREGASLRASLQQTKLFPPMMLHMIASGEKSGELDDMLARAADNQDREFEAQVSVALAVLQPLIVVVMAGIVLFIVISILQPMLAMNQMI
ncbi:type II secretion system inner membrane protein GspF [Ferrimonas balearica]|uniref:type II secretion system inner membrane protein GspF n=1 Tax=Ferrimonas balearica TaxID=44012 RepID=UPI001F16C19D|nr:type II secretion system inner membrane protein GspF [Ferrimonas balearica]MBY6019458.1 type II secretion system inner membrane protein GspF [Halomonas denitrificans]MBY6096191.1 type II secretion system inner membrane protein GspF [Ferrimonas balearica]